MRGEARLTREASAAISTQIVLHGGNEVCFVCTVDADGNLDTARKVAAGDVSSVLALPGFAERGEMLLHNHPSGDLTPSSADMDVAFRLHGNGVGFGIVNNSATRVYVVTEIPGARFPEPLDRDAIDSTLGPRGLIAEAMRCNGGPFEYEDRLGQRAMATTVTTTFNEGGVALLEAGTGIGKSLAYLVPALRWAAMNGERTVVSTATITLQEQLIRKDLPFLSNALSDQRVRFALLKGWRNYLCLNRLEQAMAAGPTLFDDDVRADLESIAEWAVNTSDGSLADLPFAPRPEVWDEVSAEPDLCGRLKCPFFNECFLFRARRHAAAADVVVVNHHLLLSDVAVRRQVQSWDDAAVLPAYRQLIVDEGHRLEEAAASHLGVSISRRALTRLFQRLERRGKGLLPVLVARLSERNDLLSVASIDLVREKLLQSAVTARDRVHLLFELLIAILEQQGGGVLRLTESFQAHDLWRNGIDGALRELLVEINAIGQGLTMVQERIESEPERAEELTSIVNEIRAVTRRLAAAGDALMQGLVPPASGPPVVRWIEPMGKPGLHERNILVQCVPIDLAPSLRDDLFRRVRTAVVTSATLSTDGGFGFISQRLGVSHLNRPIRSAIFPSPFDYPRQALLVVPTDLPAPNEQPKEHLASVVEHLCGLVEASDGGIFALFTSHRDVRDVADRLRKLGIAARRPLLVHGEEPRDQLLQLFRESGRALLLGTATFWEGVDVPGNALRGLLIGRLPFLVPTDPMVAAQCEVIDARGGSSFAEYMLPHAALRLKQGFGRLIRTTNDCGVVVLSDPRVVTRRYGRALLNSLPPAQRIIGAWRDIGVHVSRFYRYGPSVIRQTVWDES